MQKEAKQALITGGTGALARAMVRALECRGMEVIAPSKSELDVTDSEQVNAVMEQLESLDLLVCNAGVVKDAALMRLSEGNWDTVMDVNLKGAFNVARAAVKKMMKRRAGHIIFISSYSAYHPPVGQANYVAAKAGLDGFAKSLAQEVGSRNIRVNVVVPGFMETKMTENLADKVKERAMKKHLLGRFNTPEKVAEFVSFLHAEMEHTSGQVFNLDSRIL